MRTLERLFIFTFWIIIAISLYWYLYPYNIIEFQDAQFPVEKTVVYQGEEISYTSRYCKYMDLSAVVTRSYIDTLIYTMPSTVTKRMMGCHNMVFSTVIPNKLPAGKYYIHMVYKYDVNPIRTIIVEHDSESFEVKEATPSAR